MLLNYSKRDSNILGERYRNKVKFKLKPIEGQYKLLITYVHFLYLIQSSLEGISNELNSTQMRKSINIHAGRPVFYPKSN